LENPATAHGRGKRKENLSFEGTGPFSSFEHTKFAAYFRAIQFERACPAADNPKPPELLEIL